jgi:hypothetical protein
MSAPGQTRLSGPMASMSAKRPKADIWEQAGEVAEGHAGHCPTQPPHGLSPRTPLTRPLEGLQGLLRDSYRGNCRVRVGGGSRQPLVSLYGLRRRFAGHANCPGLSPRLARPDRSQNFSGEKAGRAPPAPRGPRQYLGIEPGSHSQPL